jgi:surfactin family lipopeptide synthetase A
MRDLPQHADYERVLAQVISVWDHILQSEAAPEDNFFVLGGDSLQAAHAAARLSRSTGRSVTLIGVMSQSSASELAEWICSRPILECSRGQPTISSGYRSMSFQQEWHVRRDAIRPNPRWRVNFGLHLTGPVDPDRMCAAVDHVVLRHEILRSRFFIDGTGHAVQEFSDFNPRLCVLTAPQVTHPYGFEVLKSFFNQPFNRLIGDVFHASLIRHSAEYWTLAFSVDHIAFDLLSARVLVRELSVFYDSPASAAGKLPTPRQFREYSAWQRGLVESAESARLRSFWRRYLSGTSSSALGLLRERGPDMAGLPSAERVQDLSRVRHIEKELVALVGRVAQQEGVTAYVMCLTALVLLLDAIADDRDYVVLSPVAHRDLPEFEDVIGFMAQTVPIRVQWPVDHSLRDLLRTAKSAVAACLTHSRLPLSEIRRECWPAEYVNPGPTASVFLDVVDKVDAEPIRFSRIAAVPVVMSDLRDETGDADSAGMSVLIYRAGDEWKVRMELSGRTFDNRWADRLLRGYVHALVHVVQNPGRSVEAARNELGSVLGVAGR